MNESPIRQFWVAGLAAARQWRSNLCDHAREGFERVKCDEGESREQGVMYGDMDIIPLVGLNMQFPTLAGDGGVFAGGLQADRADRVDQAGRISGPLLTKCRQMFCQMCHQIDVSWTSDMLSDVQISPGAR